MSTPHVRHACFNVLGMDLDPPLTVIDTPEKDYVDKLITGSALAKVSWTI